MATRAELRRAGLDRRLAYLRQKLDAVKRENYTEERYYLGVRKNFERQVHEMERIIEREYDSG